MESRALSSGAVTETTDSKTPSSGRRKRRNGDEAPARFFLPKPGTTAKMPELGTEVPTEGDALIQSLKSDNVFYVVTVWKAVAQQNGGDPVITKEAVNRTQA